jgi:hypothetical protein
MSPSAAAPDHLAGDPVAWTRVVLEPSRGVMSTVVIELFVGVKPHMVAVTFAFSIVQTSVEVFVGAWKCITLMEFLRNAGFAHVRATLKTSGMTGSGITTEPIGSGC